MDKKILCLDFDGVIHSYTSGWKGARSIPDMPVTGALEFIVTAMEYFNIAIFSSRSHQWGGKRAMKRWLWDKYAEIAGIKRPEWPSPFIQFESFPTPNMPEWYFKTILNKTGMDPWENEVDYGIKRLLKRISFPTVKPPAFLMIDDRGWRFDGNFPDPEKLLDLKVWYAGSPDHGL